MYIFLSDVPMLNYVCSEQDYLISLQPNTNGEYDQQMVSNVHFGFN
jgi:hypothetical protein